jgi:hypothetical protein
MKEKESIIGVVPAWVRGRAAKAVQRAVGQDLLRPLEAHHRDLRARITGGSRLLLWIDLADRAVPAERVVTALQIVSALAVDLPAWIARLVPGPLERSSVDAGPLDPGSVVPVEPPPGCVATDWHRVREAVIEPVRDPEWLRRLLVMEWGSFDRWSLSRRRSLGVGLRYCILVQQFARIVDVRSHLAFQDLRWAQTWRQQFAPLGDGLPGPAGGGRRLRPSRVPRYLAAWLLRRAGLGSQASGYLLAVFGLAGADWSLSKKAVARRLNTQVGKALSFWRRLESERLAAGGEPQPLRLRDGLGAAPHLLINHFLWHVWDRLTPIGQLVGGRVGHARPEALELPVPSREWEPLEYVRAPTAHEALIRYLERMSARHVGGLGLEEPVEHLDRFSERLLESGAPLRVPTTPSEAVDAAAWVLEVMPGCFPRVRSGVLEPEARGWRRWDVTSVVPEPAPPGIEADQWRDARRLLLERAPEYPGLFELRLAAARGWLGDPADAPKPLGMLLAVASAYRDLLLALQAQKEVELEILRLDRLWNLAWRSVFWPAGLQPDGSVKVATAARQRGAAHLHLASWLLRHAGLSRMLIGGVLVHFGAAPAHLAAQAEELAGQAPTVPLARSELPVVLRRVSKRSLQVWLGLDRARSRVCEDWEEEGVLVAGELFDTLQRIWLSDRFGSDPERATRLGP